MLKASLLLSFAGSAFAGHCSGGTPPDYCCIMACDSSYANHPSYYGPGTTPACGTAGATTLAQIYATAGSQGCAPLTENSCAFGPYVHSTGTCNPETVLEGAIPGVTITGDPHLSLPHGGKADFRGEHMALYNFLSSKSLALNVMTELADFELHKESHPQHKLVHGSFITQAHMVVKTNGGKTVRVSYWANKIGPTNLGWVNGTVDNEPVFTLSKKTDPSKEYIEKVVDDLTLRMGYSSLTLLTPEFELVVTPMHFGEERNVQGLHHRLDIKMALRVPEADLAVAPHGIIGQGWDGDNKAIDGEQDSWPKTGEFTTYAMARGAIEGTPNDYKVASRYATDFKYSRFGASALPARDVAKLVGAGLLSQPKTVAASATVGATEYNFTNL